MTDNRSIQANQRGIVYTGHLAHTAISVFTSLPRHRLTCLWHQSRHLQENHHFLTEPRTHQRNLMVSSPNTQHLTQSSTPRGNGGEPGAWWGAGRHNELQCAASALTEQSCDLMHEALCQLVLPGGTGHCFTQMYARANE